MKRRNFVSGLAGSAAVFHIVPRHVLGGPNHVPPSEQVNLAIVGAGGRGRRVLRGMMQEPEVRAVAVADPATEFSLQEFYYRDIGGRVPTRNMIEEHYGKQDKQIKCAEYVDFRQMLEDEKDLDAVLCATPDHLHAYVSSKCLSAGKHVYCEKPLTHNIWEAREIAKLAKSTGLATQMGNQGHSTAGIRTTCEWIWAGAIGEVREVKAWVSGHRWNPTLTGKPETGASVPDGIDWDLWLGPREPRAFEPAYFPVAWRDFWAFGNSNIGDFGCHDLDAACWALDLTHPSSIEFFPAGPCNEEIGPHGCLGFYEFPSNDKRGRVKVTWHDGGIKPDRPIGWPPGEPLPNRGVLFIGSEGVIFCGGAGAPPKIISQKTRKAFIPPKETIPRVASHARDWLDAIHGKGDAGSNFGYGAKLSELALLGALSLRTGKRIDWDGEAAKAKGNPAADKIIKEGYRAGWELEI